MTSLSDRTLVYVYQHPGIFGMTVADHFQVEHVTYGRQRATSQAIASLRRLKLLHDVKRCRVCHRALTRGERNVPLYVTARGARMARKLILSK